MDISAINYKANAENAYTFKLVLDGDETDIELTVIGADSKAYRSAFTKELRANADAENVDVDASNARIYSVCLVGWTNIEEGKKPLEYSQENALYLLEQYPLICNEVSKAVEKRANFTPPNK